MDIKQKIIVGVFGAFLIGGGAIAAISHNPGDASATPSTHAPAQTEPAAPPSPPPETVSITSLSSPASPGSTATLAAHTMPNSDCSIVVNYKSGPSKAQGLFEHNSDSNGDISW